MTACVRCAAPGKTVELERDGKVEITVTMCDACFASLLAGADELDREFKELVAAGIPRETASAILIAKIEGRQGQA